MSNRDRLAIGLILTGVYWLYRSEVAHDNITALAKGIIGTIFFFVGVGGFAIGDIFSKKDKG